MLCPERSRIRRGERVRVLRSGVRWEEEEDEEVVVEGER